MAKKLGLGTASTRVLAIASGFDDALLADEERAIEQINDRLTEVLSAARREVEAGLRRARGDMKRYRSIASTRNAVVKLHTAALRTCVPIVAGLAATALDASLRSVQEELEVCAQTMHPRFAKLPEVAVRVALTVREEILDNAAAAASTAVRETARKFQPDYTQQSFAAIEGDEFLNRMFSPDKVAARGFNRRGVWWSASSDLQSAARAISTECANLIRQSAMHTFNEVGKAHR